jgi:hypothetical protein
VTAEHFSTPGRFTMICANREVADKEALALTQSMLDDYLSADPPYTGHYKIQAYGKKPLTLDNYAKALEAINKDVSYSDNEVCYVDISEHDLIGNFRP